MQSDLQNSIDDLYNVFSDYLRPETIDTSPVKDFDEAWSAIGSKPLRTLSSDELCQYAFSALTTIGDEKDFKHFLPRLLELTISDLSYCNDILALKLVYAKWRSWPENEQSAIENFLMAWWKYVLSIELTEDIKSLATTPVEDTLFIIADVIEDLKVFLDYWNEQRSVDATLYIALFINNNFEMMCRLKNKMQMIQVRDWVFCPAKKERLEEVFFNTDDEDDLSLLSEAVQKFEWWQELRDR